MRTCSAAFTPSKYQALRPLGLGTLLLVTLGLSAAKAGAFDITRLDAKKRSAKNLRRESDMETPFSLGVLVVSVTYGIANEQTMNGGSFA